MNHYLAEGKALKIGVLPVDANTAAITGERISLKEMDRVAIVVQMGDSTGATVDFTLRQHDAASAGNSKDLEVANAYYHKAGAATSFTKVEPTVASAGYDLSAIFGANEGIVVFEVSEAQLDVENGFSHVSIDIADSAAAKLVSVIYVGQAQKLPAFELAL
jgi:hypothetical protein